MKFSGARPTALLVLAGLAAFAGCASPSKPELDANGKPIEYIYVTPTGSHIPVKIRKDQVRPSTDEESASDQDMLRKAQLKGMRQDKQSGGN